MLESKQPLIGRLAAVPTDPIWRLSVEQYHTMVQLGVLTNDDPVELLEGWLICKMPKNPPHRAVTRLVREALAGILPEGWYVDSQEPITTPDSEPEPDVVIVRGHTRQYLNRHPGPSDLALVVEVSDTTLQRDRTIKKRTYARAEIPAYWIVNLPENKIEVYLLPSGPVKDPDYQHRQDYGLSDTISLTIAGVDLASIPVCELLP